jgi:hypothetical protein
MAPLALIKGNPSVLDFEALNIRVDWVVESTVHLAQARWYPWLMWMRSAPLSEWVQETSTPLWLMPVSPGQRFGYVWVPTGQKQDWVSALVRSFPDARIAEVEHSDGNGMSPGGVI